MNFLGDLNRIIKKKENRINRQEIKDQEAVFRRKIDKHLDENLKKLNEEKNSKKNKLKFSFWEIIRSVFFPFFLSKNHLKKLKLYNKASNGLLKYINILQIVQMLQQLEKLKLIIFNKEQLALFNYLSKPLISMENEEHESNDESFTLASGTKLIKIMKYMEGENPQEQCKDILKYYNNLLETGKYSNIDKKLFELLDDDLKLFLDRFSVPKLYE